MDGGRGDFDEDARGDVLTVAEGDAFECTASEGGCRVEEKNRLALKRFFCFFP